MTMSNERLVSGSMVKGRKRSMGGPQFPHKETMMGMQKLELAVLEAAYRGN
jgi:hypothetical protein